MYIDFDINTAERNVVDKTAYLTTLFTEIGYFREEANIQNPSIILEVSDTNLSYFNQVNYAYISELDKYYFISDKTVLSSSNDKTLYRIDFIEDVLMSYKSDILNCDAYITRNEFHYDDNYKDDRMPFRTNKEYTVQTIESVAFDPLLRQHGFNFVIITAKGGEITE